MPTVREGALRRCAAVALTTVIALTAGCSSSRDLESAAQTGTTIRDLGEELVEDEALIVGSEGAKEMQKIIDRLLASNDACAILTQKDIKGYKIDATALASSSARQVLANGVVDVYDHLIALVTDASVKPALQTQRDTFGQVLSVVDRYTANPTSAEANDQIQALVTGEEFVRAESAVSTWTFQNCS